MKRIVAVVWLALTPAFGGAGTNVQKVLASPDDCAIFAVLAKAKLGWTATAAPEGNYIFESQIADGPNEKEMGTPKTFIAQCPWHELDLAEPVSNPEGGPKNYALGRPIRAVPDVAHATWNRFDFETKDGRQDLHHRFQLCKLAKRDGQWQLDSCDAEQDIIRDSRPAPK